MLYERRRRWMRSARLLGICAVVSGGLLAAPSIALAVDTLSLGVEPAIPGQGKAFQLIASGNVDSLGEGGGPNIVVVHLAPGTSGCASTAALEEENPKNLENGSGTAPINAQLEQPGPFEERGIYDNPLGFNDDVNVGSGVRTGHYRACGYLYEGGGNHEGSPPKAFARLPFTVGGTCETATADVAKAKKALKKAKKKLKAAKESGDEARIKKAKTAVKKAKRKLKTAQEDAAALCVG